MNERIQELAKGAKHAFEQEGILLELVLEKFAELIVKECVNEILDADVDDLKGKSYYLVKVAKHIEKHFGVEE